MTRTRLTMAGLVSIAALVGCHDATRPELDETSLTDRQARLIQNHYIVVFTDEVTDPPAAARGLAIANGLELRHTYSSAVKGFAAVVPPGRVDALRTDPRVRYVAADRVDEIHQQQDVPTGIDRIDADLNTSPAASDPVDVDIAILDTGVDPDHPELNVYRVVSFAGGKGEDGNGHGSHVAGTAAAKDNGTGVVGVAPGARIWAVKVCNNGGSCARSDIIAGIDFVTQNADAIDVVNMSLGGRGADDGNCGLNDGDVQHEAICNAVAKGVVFVVSAGNSSTDAASFVPASYDQVITVSALADFDGKPGGAGTSTCREDEDDSFASFSNYGPDVDLMAPGVCIESAWKQGGYNIISGTSMAAPHVTGTVALFVARNGRDVNGDQTVNGTDVELIRSALVDAGIPQLDPCGFATFDDPDGIAEPVVFANATNVGGDGSCTLAAPVAADIAIEHVSVPTAVAPGGVVDVTVTVTNLTATGVVDDIYVVLTSDNATPNTDDDITIGSETIIGGLAAGQSTDIEFSWNTVGVNVGDHTLTAVHALSDADGANNTLTASVTIEGAALPTLHVGNLERSSANDGGGTWTAWVRITVHDADEGAPVDALVEGTWDNNGNTPTTVDTCPTDATGMCELSYGGIPNRDGNIVFWVDNVTLPDFAYDQSADHHPGEDPQITIDSQGTRIRVFFKNSIDYKEQ
jgi:subtilisin